MPEGPEVREFYLYMSSLVINKIIKEVKVLSGKFLEKKPIKHIDKIVDLIIKSCFVKGKTIFLEFQSDTGNSPVGMSFVHGMTGNWSEEHKKHSRLSIELISKDDSKQVSYLYYNDTRNFGLIDVYMSDTDFEFAQSRLGPDVLNDSTTYTEFYSRLDTKPRSKLGIILLDQKILAGVGNYLRCDILWYINKVCGFDKINHTRLIGSLTKEEKKCLYEITINMCRYRANLTYRLDINLDDFYVYSRDYDIYNNPVIRESFGGRTIHHCI